MYVHNDVLACVACSAALLPSEITLRSYRTFGSVTKTSTYMYVLGVVKAGNLVYIFGLSICSANIRQSKSN